MDWLREWAMAVCSAAVFGAAITLLSPDDRFEKLVNICVSVFILLVIVSPLASLDGCTRPDIAAEEYSATESELDSLVSEQTVSYLADTAQKLIEARLTENGIFAEEISVIMDSSEDGCISIGQVTITMADADADARENVRSLISQWMGTENVQVTGGADEQDQGNN